MNYAEFIKIRRVDQSLSQERLAALVGTTSTTISRIERGIQDPSGTMIDNILDVLGYKLVAVPKNK